MAAVLVTAVLVTRRGRPARAPRRSAAPPSPPGPAWAPWRAPRRPAASRGRPPRARAAAPGRRSCPCTVQTSPAPRTAAALGPRSPRTAAAAARARPSQARPASPLREAARVRARVGGQGCQGMGVVAPRTAPAQLLRAPTWQVGEGVPAQLLLALNAEAARRRGVSHRLHGRSEASGWADGRESSCRGAPAQGRPPCARARAAPHLAPAQKEAEALAAAPVLGPGVAVDGLRPAGGRAGGRLGRCDRPGR
jgi:hypothetical protein